MYEVTINGEHHGTGGTFLAARNTVLIPELCEMRLLDLVDIIDFTGDADAMIDCKAWRDDAGNVAVIEYVDEGDTYTGPTFMEYDEEAW